MTLTTVDRYDDDRVNETGGHAVVVGASVAGLCAARVLHDAFERVTVVERDALPDDPTGRRGVPQATQPHLLWEAGRRTLDDLFTGFSEDLHAAGAPAVRARRDLLQYSEGDFLAHGADDLTLYTATRPVYEHVLRRRVVALDGVRIRDRCHLVEYHTAGGGANVDGVVVRGRSKARDERDTNGESDVGSDGDSDDGNTTAGGTTTIDADLVVDATGRASRTPSWLATHGYDRPALEEVGIDVAYATVTVDRPGDDTRAIGVLAEAPRTRGGVALPVEGDRWLVNLHGVHGDHPPTDEAGLRRFAGTLPTPEIAQILDGHAWDGAAVREYRFPSNRRYRYADLDRFPRGLAVVGDAVASFNPIYGQGMSVAALEALALHEVLGEATAGGTEPGAGVPLALRVFDRAAPIVDTAWGMAVGADFGYSQTGTQHRCGDRRRRFRRPFR
ncbi:FAD-dependent oxidoreductase [Halobaculum rarum]|uniref:FAD-dependent oxidoreductase n=1 Tax=Halobaculum rarum TaxID=3075122 RepID=UPI0032AF6447